MQSSKDLYRGVFETDQGSKQPGELCRQEDHYEVDTIFGGVPIYEFPGGDRQCIRQGKKETVSQRECNYQ